MSKLKKYLIAGLLVWVPLVVTFLLVRFTINLVDRTLVLIPRQYRPETLLGFEVPGIGLVLTLTLMLVTGAIVANFFGRRLVNVWEEFLSRIPFVRTVYSTVKQVTSTLFSDTSQSFREVVLVEYPRKGTWVLAFVTGETPEFLTGAAGMDLVNLFVPTTPNPTSGFYVMVEPSDIRRLDISVEDGLKMILSAGVINPLENKQFQFESFRPDNQAQDEQPKP
ncbi:MAG: DUF502 domain-containing protein [Arenicella sp.]